VAADSHWSAAVRVAAERLKPLTVLYSLATAWGWDDQREEILNTLIERHPNERWAFAALDQFYSAGGNTRGLQKVFARLVDIHPEDLGAKNNLAYINTLLGVQPSQTLAMAREVFAAFPTNAVCASTFALALHAQGQTSEALKVLQKLTPAQLEYPGITFCYGVILAASGDHTNSAKYLDLAAKEKLLVEEEKLLKTARGEN
jgi:DNA-binding SARP family transcriptional activator